MASLFEERTVAPDNQLAYDWTFEVPSTGQPLAWPESRLAFDYGLHIAGAHREGQWVRLLSKIPVDGWLRITDGQAGSFFIEVSPLQGEIIALSPMMATWPDGHQRRIDGGSYLVKRLSKTGVIWFRAEIPSDYACGELVTDPVPLPPMLRTEAGQFFNPDGTPRFATVYTKGC